MVGTGTKQKAEENFNCLTSQCIAAFRILDYIRDRKGGCFFARTEKSGEEDISYEDRCGKISKGFTGDTQKNF